ncbi:uncharacterized protein CTRU02_209162 [Colletotrichum truncatum]|uniref:Uncharacterized protein n=3 Tax=Colletotrichum truncatum TaxID=5467 RepID=A0ACC3YC68_COLTU
MVGVLTVGGIILVPVVVTVYASFARRSGVSLGLIGQPPGTLSDSFSALDRWEIELETLGNPGITSRASTLARMDASELVTHYKDLTSRLEAIHASIAHLTNECQLLGQQVSEVSLVLSFQRTFEVRRIPPGLAHINFTPIVCPPSGHSNESNSTIQDSNTR